MDLEKAFDRVPREVISWAMCKLGVEEWLILAVMSMHTGAKTVARLNLVSTLANSLQLTTVVPN